jgi:hypothetical protein
MLEYDTLGNVRMAFALLAADLMLSCKYFETNGQRSENFQYKI